MFSVTGEMIDSDNEKTTRLCVNQFVYAFYWLVETFASNGINVIKY